MNDNPYQSTSVDVGFVGGADAEWLRNVARFQRIVLLCILMQILAVAPRMALQDQMPPLIALVLGLATLVIVVVGAVFVFRLGILLYGTVAGIAAGVVSLMPCVGLIALFIVNGKATKVLRKNHIHVGFLGANMSQL